MDKSIYPATDEAPVRMLVSRLRVASQNIPLDNSSWCQRLTESQHSDNYVYLTLQRRVNCALRAVDGIAPGTELPRVLVGSYLVGLCLWPLFLDSSCTARANL